MMETNLTVSPNSQLPLQSDIQTEEKVLLVPALITPFLITALLYIVAFVRIYKKNRFDLDPIHIFELNTLLNNGLINFFEVFRILEALNPSLKLNIFCSLRSWIYYWLTYNVYNGIILSQADRFLGRSH